MPVGWRLSSMATRPQLNSSATPKQWRRRSNVVRQRTARRATPIVGKSPTWPAADYAPPPAYYPRY